MLTEADVLSAAIEPGLARVPIRATQSPTLGWLAAAAAVLLALAPFPWYRSAYEGAKSRGTIEIARGTHVDLPQPESQADGLVRIRPVASSPMTAMILTRGWNWDCQCMAWSLLPWEDGATVAELSPDAHPELALDAADLPPYDHFVILAAAPSRAALPIGADEEGDLLACLNEQPSFDAGLVEPAEVSAYVQRCLPGDVTLVSRSFCPGE